MPAKRVVFAGFPGMQSLDVTGPWEVFQRANDTHERSVYELLLATPDGRAVRTDSGLTIQASHSWRQLGPVHTAIIPGGMGIYEVIGDELAMTNLRSLTESAERVASVCTGAFALAELGLLDGKSAVTHWEVTEKFRRRYPKINVQEDHLHCVDGVWTSAGVTAGIDMVLAMIEIDHDFLLANEVAKWLVLFLRRHEGDCQLGPALESQAVQSRTIARAQTYIANHPAADLRINALATRMGMSPRNFTRVFTREVGTPPSKYVQKIRLAHALRLLETTDWSIDEVAIDSGFGSRESLRRIMLDVVGSAPAQMRRTK